MTDKQMERFVLGAILGFLVLMVLTASFCNTAHAQTSVAMSPYPRPQFLSPTAVPLAGGSIKTYTAGTTTPLATYADYQGNTQNPVTITLDSGGFPQGTNIFLGPNTYKFCAFDSLSVQQWCVDGVADIGQLLKANLALGTGSSLVGFQQIGGSALSSTLQVKLRQVPYVQSSDFSGATLDLRINRCLAALPTGIGVCDARSDEGAQSGSATISVPAGVTLLLGDMTYTSSASPMFDLAGDGASIVGAGNRRAVLITSSGTADVIHSASSFAYVSNVQIRTTGARTGGAAIHCADGCQGLFENFWIEPSYYAIKHDGGASGVYRHFRIEPTSSTPTAANWQSVALFQGDATAPAGHQVVPDVLLDDIVVVMDRPAASGYWWDISTGVDSMDYAGKFELIGAQGPSKNCGAGSTDSCGVALGLTYHGTPGLDGPRRVTFQSIDIEASTVDRGLDILAAKTVTLNNFSCSGGGPNCVRIHQTNTLPLIENVSWHSGRCLQAQQDCVLIDGGLNMRNFIIDDVLFSGNSAQTTGTYYNINLQGGAGLCDVVIQDNHFIPDYFAYTVKPVGDILLNAAGCNVYTYGNYFDPAAITGTDPIVKALAPDYRLDGPLITEGLYLGTNTLNKHGGWIGSTGGFSTTFTATFLNNNASGEGVGVGGAQFNVALPSHRIQLGGGSGDWGGTDKFALGYVAAGGVFTTPSIPFSVDMVLGSIQGGRTAIPFLSLPACGAATFNTGSIWVNNSSTAAWGANADGAGALLVRVTCNGTNWTIDAK